MLINDANKFVYFLKINSAQHEFTMARAYVCWMSSDMMEYLIEFGCSMNNMENTYNPKHIGRWLLGQNFRWQNYLIAQGGFNLYTVFTG